MFLRRPDNGKSHEKEAQESYGRTDGDAACGKNVGVESFFHGAAGAEHEQEPYDYQYHTAAHEVEVHTPERSVVVADLYYFRFLFLSPFEAGTHCGGAGGGSCVGRHYVV